MHILIQTKNKATIACLENFQTIVSEVFFHKLKINLLLYIFVNNKNTFKKLVNGKWKSS